MPTFPLVVGKELQVRVLASVCLGQMVPVGLAGVGVLITVTRVCVLEGEKENQRFFFRSALKTEVQKVLGHML